MYESTFENVKSSFQPLIELAELNRKTLEKMTSVQTSYLTDCISTSIKQVKSLAESGSPQRATELSFEMIKEFENKLAGATEQNMAALHELRAAYSALMNGSCSDNYARVTELYSLKETFAVPGFNVVATPSAAPAQKATVKKTPAIKAVVAKKASVAKDPVVTEKVVAEAVEAKVVETKTVETKAVEAKVVETKPAIKPAQTTPAKAEVVVETKPTPAPVAPAVAVAEEVKPKTAPVKAAEATPKAAVKRAAAKPSVKKAAAKSAAVKKR